MKKRWMSLLVAIVILSSTISIAGGADIETATVSQNKIFVDGIEQSISAYMIEGNNYFKLRDFAAIVNGTEKQFQVEWDQINQAIRMTSEMPYTLVGGELFVGDDHSQTAYATTSAIYLDGEQIAFTGYNIAGNNYFKLRDMAKRFDIGVEYDGKTGQVQIMTDRSYIKTVDEEQASKRAQAYLAIIEALNTQYGEKRILSGGKAVSGLVTAMLIDFDADNNPELVCGYADDELNQIGRNLNTYMSVYYWNGTTAEQITDQRAAYLFDGNGDPAYFSYGSIELYEENGKIYSYSSGIADWSQIQANNGNRLWQVKLQTVQNGKWVDDMSLVCSMEWGTNPPGETITAFDQLTGNRYVYSGQTIVSGNTDKANILKSQIDHLRANLITYAIDPPMQKFTYLHYADTPDVKNTVLLLQQQAL